MRTLLVTGKKVFRITIPDDARITFGPWSPPTGEGRYAPDQKSLSGTLRIYEGGKTKTTESILAVFSEVRDFRDLSRIEYEEQVVIEKGSVVWDSDRSGYKREERVQREKHWDVELLEDGE